MNKLRHIFNQYSIRTRSLIIVIGILGVLALGIGNLLLRYIGISHDRNMKSFALNMADSISISIQNDFAAGNIYTLDRFFLSLSQENLREIKIHSCTLVDNKEIIAADMAPQHFQDLYKNPIVPDELMGQKTHSKAELVQYQNHWYVTAVKPLFSKTNRIGRLILVLEIDSLMEEYYYIITLSILLSIGFILLLGYFFFLLINSFLIQRIENLSLQANELSQGNMYHQISVTGNDEISLLGTTLEVMRENILQEQENLKLTLEKTSASEKKYRFLIEGSKDIICILDKDLNILDANKALQKNLGYGVNETEKISLLDVIHQDYEDDTLILQLFKEKFTAFLSDKKPMRFNLKLKSRYSKEPLDYSINMELTEMDSETEIIAKLTSSHFDNLTNYILKEKQQLAIGNYLLPAEEVSNYLVKNLSKFFDKNDIFQIRVCLREMIINAIEHGNLAVSFYEKSEHLEKGDYLEFLRERQEDPRYINRKVNIEYLLDENQIAFRVTDEGSGFDYKKIKENEIKSVNEEYRMHGRGILITEKAFDKVDYVGRGNQVVLIKYLPK